ncbi:MAG: hypothetical protein LBO80_07475 [Treponema sp.]|jgi:hypothetical protein|nr:hypothetical protein [Treponema sp.]
MAAKTERIILGLEKLYAKRKVLDKQISELEKTLVSEAKSVNTLVKKASTTASTRKPAAARKTKVPQKK